MAWRKAAIASSTLPWLRSTPARSAIRVGKVGLDPDGPAVSNNGLVELALLVQRYAEAAKVPSTIFVVLYGLIDQVNGQVMSASLLGNHTEQMQCISMAVLARRHPPVASLGFGQAARLVMLATGR